ncbi:hypothetical protein Tco_0354318, partial [Tanacetum coccineum]
MPHLNRPTSSYFQTYTPYVPQMYYNHMLYGGVRWATAVKPSAGHTSGGAEDLITLTVVSSVVSTLVQKVNSLETEPKDTKKLFKDVVGKLVKKVKA